MTQPDTGPLCRDCKHSQATDAGLFCHHPKLKQKTSGKARRCIGERSFIFHVCCGPTGKNFEAKP